MKIAIIDYGMGNIHSLKSALLHIAPNATIQIGDDKDMLSNSDVLFLPGVGHFKAAISKLQKRGLVDILKKLVLTERKPIMGICLGMQLLFKDCSEGGFTKGLEFFNAEVRRIPGGHEKIPHIGFDTISPEPKTEMFKNLEYLDFYFVHSYCVTGKPQGETKVAYCKYNGEFIAAIESPGIWGTQFHPEKSQEAGLQLLKNFLDQHGK